MDGKNDGGAAFPMLGNTRERSELDLDIVQVGMTLRDYFAARAMQGDWADGQICMGQDWLKERAELYYRAADAMLAAREKKGGT